MSRFVHLHTHTEFSLLDGLSKIPKLVKAAKDLGMEALAITDHGSMYGAIEFYKACLDAGIKPIIGCELYVAPRSHLSKEGKLDTEPYHLTMLAKNYQGYLNLMKLVSVSHLEGFYYKPRVDKELLKQYHEGLICLSGCPAGEFIRNLKAGDFSKGEAVAKEYSEIFGEGNYYLELQNHFYKDILAKGGLEDSVRRDLENMAQIQDLTWEAAKTISKKTGIPLVATNDLHYIKKEDAPAQDALVCIQTGKTLTDMQRLRMIDTPDLFLKSAGEMEESFKEIPEALESTVEIAGKVNIEIPLGTPRFPVFEVPEGRPAFDYLKELTFDRGKDRMEMTQERVTRLNYELSVIEKKKYATYFLVVQDFITWANKEGIITNTRGSAAGSLVLFALGVTNIDPIHYKIPFERFLNPFRPSLPDIDADMADDRRDDVIRYVMGKYGEDKVAHIVTFGTMMGRAAIRDIGRVMAVPYGEVDRIAKLVPPPYQGFHKPLADAIKEVPELADLYRTDAAYKKLLDLAVKVESTVRHASVHAAGIVIAPEPLTRFTPLQKEANGDKVVTQYDMGAAEAVGLVKMDFLGIRNLSILGRAVEFVKKNRNIEVDLDNIPLDDKKSFEILAKGETMGLFQLEGSGMTKWLVDLKPTTIYDIMAMIALYRPGPMGSIPDYIQRKHDPSKIKYFDPRMEEYMQQSLGLLVYQEDVLLTAINIAGYSWLDADKFRKAMGKKIPTEMAKQKDSFIKGAVEKGMAKEKADELWGLIEPFAAYGFPKAHAASYGMISYQTAYMKANFPVEFMAAVMTAEYGNTEKIAHAIEECKRMGIVVMPPDVKFSGVGFTIENLDTLSEKELERNISKAKNAEQTQGIRFGLSAIKNVGISAIESILAARGDKTFSSISDLCARVDTRLVNRKTLESLVKAGALDSFGTRAALLLNLDEILEQAHKNARLVSSGQVSLFGEEESQEIANMRLPEVPELDLDKLLIFEKDLLGFYLHEPPYLGKLKLIEQAFKTRIGQFEEYSLNQRITFGGVIVEVKKVLTKKSASEMSFVKISDGTSEIECVVFPKAYALSKSILNKEEVVVITGKLDKREDELSVLVDTVEVFNPDEFYVLDVDDSGRPGTIEDRQRRESAMPDPGVEVSLQTESGSSSQMVELEIPQNAGGDLLKQINSELKKYPGNMMISLLLPSNGSYKRLNLPFTVNPEAALLEKLRGILGPGAVKLS